MITTSESVGGRAAWFVGAAFGGTDDQTARFLRDGIWEIRDPTDRDRVQVRSMRVGDRIAIKAAYVRKKDLPFDNRGHPVSVMGIKAVGTIAGNSGDGERVTVRWEAPGPLREWYFFTGRTTIWRLVPGEWMADGLIDFAFEGKPQDIQRFCNEPYWRERFGSKNARKGQFEWTAFYEAIANRLLEHRKDRSRLLAALEKIASGNEGVGHLRDKYPGGKGGFLRDICPFTTLGIFNRGLTVANRRAVAGDLATFLGVESPVPTSFDGVPLLNLQNSWYFPFEKDRDPGHIEALWEVFETGMRFADSVGDGARERFASAFDDAIARMGVGWNLTFGLYWIRPWSFLSLDQNSREYITTSLRIQIPLHGPKNRCNATDYLSVMENLELRFQERDYPAHSYPELSYKAWRGKPADEEVELGLPGSERGNGPEEGAGAGASAEGGVGAAEKTPYDVEDVLSDGCFLSRSEIDRAIERLRDKKNVILQGPPGTGKTWLAKRLAFALMGQRNEGKVRAVQFHPNLSYEDFVRGWRPTGEGKLALADGVFMEAIREATRAPSEKVVVVIEEINRGNPAQIFGELLTLLEAGKRTPREALELCYPDADGRRRPVHIPENLYVIGTMNVADRSLALVDFALRRRFAFIELEPRFGEVWRAWVAKECNLDGVLAVEIERRIVVLNSLISTDSRLGPQFRVGHSFVTPTGRIKDGGTRDWFREVVETEIGPLLDEYWFDASEVARKARQALLQEW